MLTHRERRPRLFVEPPHEDLRIPVGEPRYFATMKTRTQLAFAHDDPALESEYS